MISAILFDLDDTLYPEQAWRSSGFDAVAAHVERRCGRPASEVRNELDRLDRGTDRSSVFDQLVVASDPDGVFAPELVDLFRAHLPTHLQLFPGAAEYLDACPVPIGIITDGFWLSQIRKLEALDVRRRVGPVIVTDLLAATGAAWKPSEQPYRVALSALGLEADQAIFVGDNPRKDFVAPNALGMKSVQLRLPGQVHSGEPADAEHAATWTVTDWQELTALLEREVS